MLLLSEDTQVIFCDLHQSLINQSQTISPDTLAANNGILAELCLHFQLPACLLTVPVGSKLTGVIESIQTLQTPNNTFYRVDADPFRDEALTKHLAGLSAKTVVISGFSTEVGVMFTSLGALRQGYRVIVAVDAIGSRSPRTESAAINYLTSVGAQILPLSTIAVSLESDFYSSQGKKVLSCISRIKC